MQLRIERALRFVRERLEQVGDHPFRHAEAHRHAERNHEICIVARQGSTCARRDPDANFDGAVIAHQGFQGLQDALE